MDIRNGMPHLDKFVRGSGQSLAAMGDIVAEYARNFGMMIRLTHADDPEKAAAMRKDY